MRLIALQQFTYAGIPLRVGEVFIADSEEDARILKGFGRAKDDDQTHTYRTEAMSPKGKRRYRRADLEAED